MKSLKEWRESTAPAIDIQSEEPNDQDWEFYKQKVQGRALVYLNWLIDELKNKQGLSLIRKGFIVQEIMDALGLNAQQVVKITSNIKRAMMKRNVLQRPQSPIVQPTNMQ